VGFGEKDREATLTAKRVGFEARPAEPNRRLRGARRYIVKAGDTLGTIARVELGNADAYIAIFDANRDQLDDPNHIRPGQILRLPASVR
jgi:5'-nucleotidase / UDP-sugar diphosphatase